MEDLKAFNKLTSENICNSDGNNTEYSGII